MPPTPTALPPGSPHIDLGDGYSLWSGTDAAIQTWNWLGDWGAVLQLFILVVLVLLTVHALRRFANHFTDFDSKM